MADTSFLLNGFSVLGDPRVNTNASGGGSLMIHRGQALYENDDIIMLQVTNVTEDGALTADSQITGIIVYDSATDYYYDQPKYIYTASSPDDYVDLGTDPRSQGDTYLLFDASSLSSDDPSAPQLGEVLVGAGLDLVSSTGNKPVVIDQTLDVDYDGDGTIGPDELGDGTFSTDINLLGVICFARGTLIETAEGPRPIETLREGDLVVTLDHGARPVRWIGSCKVPGVGVNAPVRIRRGALGNVRDLWVSQNHRMLVSGPRAELFFGQPEVLAAAKHLCDGDRIAICPCPEIEYFHFLFDEHEVVFAEACPAESLYPGAQTLGTLDEAARDEIVALFPELQAMTPRGPLSRRALRAHEAQAWKLSA